MWFREVQRLKLKVYVYIDVDGLHNELQLQPLNFSDPISHFGRFEIKTKLVGGGDSKDEVKEARILNRIIRCTSAGWEYEADQRHVDLIVKETGADKASVLSHPGGDKKDIENGLKPEQDEKEKKEKSKEAKAPGANGFIASDLSETIEMDLIRAHFVKVTISPVAYQTVIDALRRVLIRFGTSNTAVG